MKKIINVVPYDYEWKERGSPLRNDKMKPGMKSEDLKAKSFSGTID